MSNKTVNCDHVSTRSAGRPGDMSNKTVHCNHVSTRSAGRSGDMSNKTVNCDHISTRSAGRPGDMSNKTVYCNHASTRSAVARATCQAKPYTAITSAHVVPAARAHGPFRSLAAELRGLNALVGWVRQCTYICFTLHTYVPITLSHHSQSYASLASLLTSCISGQARCRSACALASVLFNSMFHSPYRSITAHFL
jgi:hypothetical protein